MSIKRPGYSGSNIPSQKGAVVDIAPTNSKGYFPGRIPQSPVEVGGAMNIRYVAAGPCTFRSYEILVPDKSITIVAPNLNRKYLALQNKDPNFDVQIAFGHDSVESGVNSWDLYAKNSLTFEFMCPTNDVQAICTPTAIVSIIEGYLDIPQQ